VINFSIDDYISPDPLIGYPSFRWFASNHMEMISILNDIHSLSKDKYFILQNNAVEYAKDYLTPVDYNCINNILRPS
jgi:hypothetical protein